MEVVTDGSGLSHPITWKKEDAHTFSDTLMCVHVNTCKQTQRLVCQMGFTHTHTYTHTHTHTNSVFTGL